MKFAPVLLLLSCGPVAVPQGAGATCETACGMLFVGEFGNPAAYPELTGPWSCAAFQAVEHGIIARFPEANDSRFRDVCSSIKGWTVEMKESADWKEPGFNTRLSGLTNCYARHTFIGNSPADRSSLPHEIAHAAQGCWEQQDCAHPGTDDNHFCWVENGIYRAAANANLEAWQRMPKEWFFAKDGGP